MAFLSCRGIERFFCAKNLFSKTFQLHSPLSTSNGVWAYFCSVKCQDEEFKSCFTHNTFNHFSTNTIQFISVLQCASKFEVELDLDKGLVVIPPVQGSKSQVHLIHGPTTSSKPGMCDGQALVRLDFSGPYKKAKIELMYGREPRLWTATISDSERSYGFGLNYDFSSNCASVQLYNRQFRIYSNRLPGYMFKTIDGDSLMTVLDDVVDKGVNMTIDISDETVNWKTHSGNRTKFFYDVKPPFRNNKYLFTLSGQAPVYGPPTDSYVYAGFNRVPYGNFHNGSGLCRVKITFKRDLRKGRYKPTLLYIVNCR